jgi:hypothetical protein
LYCHQSSRGSETDDGDQLRQPSRLCYTSWIASTK